MSESYQSQVDDQIVTFEPVEIEDYKRRLLAKRHQLLQTLEQVKPIAERKSAQSDETGDLSSLPFHQADIGTEHFEQELNQRHLERQRQNLIDIDNALGKIQEHKFGICEVDHKPISRERLKAIPWTRYCIDCEQNIEAGR